VLDPQDTDQDDLRGGHAPWRTDGRPRSQALKSDRRCEVLVVGAGITGAMVAEHLTSLGHEVCIVDRERPGFGSTAASTAMLQWEIDRSLTELTNLYGFERAANIYRQSLHAVMGLKELIGALRLPCEFRPRRSLYLASGEGTGAVELRREHDLRERAGLPGFYLDHPTLLRDFGITREAAILSPGSADADPLCVAHSLLATAVSRGALLFDGEATRYETTGGGLAVGLADGRTIEAQRVVLATGYVMPDFVDTDLHRPSSSWAIATPPQKPQVLWPDRPLIWEATTPYFYARTTTDDRIIIGGEDDPALIEPADRDAAMPAKSERILQQLKTLCPDAELRADYSWSGAFSETSDGLPLIGRVRGYPHLYAAYGYGGNGITFSFLAARMIARMIVGEDEPWYADLAVDRPNP
jgi:glycine/D-amino acid oxidase-like deaminating enzyme